MQHKTTNNCHFIMQEEEKKKIFPSQRKRHGKVNQCPSSRKLHANKKVQIGVYQPGMGKGDTELAQENRQITGN